MKKPKNNAAAKPRNPEREKYLSDFVKRFEELYNAPDEPLSGSQSPKATL